MRLRRNRRLKKKKVMKKRSFLLDNSVRRLKKAQRKKTTTRGIGQISQRYMSLFFFLLILWGVGYSVFVIYKINHVVPRRYPNDVEVVEEWGGETRLTMLLIGIDRPTQNSEYGFVDYLSLILFNPEDSKIGVFNFDVNMNLWIPSKGQSIEIRKLFNLSYMEQNGNPMVYLEEGVKQLTSSNIDRYAILDQADLKAFGMIINGINVTNNMTLRDMDNNFTLNEGEQHLNGDDLSSYLAVDEDSTDNKLSRQNAFLVELLHSIISFRNVIHIGSIIEVFENNFYTNLTASDLVSLVSLLRSVDFFDLQFVAQSDLVYYGNSSYANVEAFDYKIATLFIYKSVDKEQARVEVFNGAGIHGLGAQIARVLKNRGLDVIRYGNPDDNYEKTLIYTKDQERYKNTIKAIEEALGMEPLIIDQELPFTYTGDVILVLGEDYSQ